MSIQSSVTESVVRQHLQAFIEQQGVAAIVNDYDDDARFVTEARIYRGKKEIGEFFADFIGSLPPGSIERFSLRTLRTEGNIAYITWSIGGTVPLGTDTFVVHRGKIVSQTFAMCAASARQ